MNIYENEILSRDLELNFIKPIEDNSLLTIREGIIQPSYNAISIHHDCTNLGHLRSFELILVLLLATIAITSSLKMFFSKSNINTQIPNVLSILGSCTLIIITQNIGSLYKTTTLNFNSLLFVSAAYIIILIIISIISAQKLSDSSKSDNIVDSYEDNCEGDEYNQDDYKDNEYDEFELD